MKVLNAKRMQCPCCMEEHEVQSVIVLEDNIFKGVPVTYDAEGDARKIAAASSSPSFP